MRFQPSNYSDGAVLEDMKTPGWWGSQAAVVGIFVAFIYWQYRNERKDWANRRRP